MPRSFFVQKIFFLASAMSWAGLFFAPTANAQWGGGGGSLYSEDGVEISIDRKVTALFTVLNALGYDKEEHVGAPPLFLPEYSQGRAAGRKALRRPGMSLKDLGKTVAKFPLDVDQYIKAALELGGAPRFAPRSGASKLAKALSKDLAAWYNEEGGKSATDAAIKRTSKAQKALLKPVNQTTKKITQLIHMGDEEDQLLEDESNEAGRVILVLNPMDAHDTLLTIDGAAIIYVVSGPTREKAPKKTLAAVAYAYARQLMRHDVEVFIKSSASKNSFADGFDTLPKEAQKAAGSKVGYTLDLLSCGLVSVVHPKMECDAASLGNETGKTALLKLAPLARAYSEDTALFKDALPELLGVGAAVVSEKSEQAVPEKAAPAQGAPAKVEPTKKAP